MSNILIKQEIAVNSIKRLSELYKDWLEENHKSMDEPITKDELGEFFEYVGNAFWNGL